jgi:hypothetical protein
LPGSTPVVCAEAIAQQNKGTSAPMKARRIGIGFMLFDSFSRKNKRAAVGRPKRNPNSRFLASFGMTA